MGLNFLRLKLCRLITSQDSSGHQHVIYFSDIQGRSTIQAIQIRFCTQFKIFDHLSVTPQRITPKPLISDSSAQQLPTTTLLIKIIAQQFLLPNNFCCPTTLLKIIQLHPLAIPSHFPPSTEVPTSTRRFSATLNFGPKRPHQMNFSWPITYYSQVPSQSIQSVSYFRIQFFATTLLAGQQGQLKKGLGKHKYPKG